MKQIIILLLLPFTTMAQKNYLLVGTYTGAGSEGIYVYDFDLQSGSATFNSMATTSNPSYLAVSPDQQFVFAVNEDGLQQGGGKVSAFKFSRGRLSAINQQSSGGEHPCYITVDKNGKWVIAGNYSSGSLTVLPVGNDGKLQVAADFAQHSGRSITSRQEGPHVHATVLSPDNKYLIVTDLGLDKVKIYHFDPSSGQLTPAPVQEINTKPGAGPRHFIFHPKGKYGYLIQELSGLVSVYQYHDGQLNHLQDISSLPGDFSGRFSSADLHVSPDGKFLYVSNRDELNQISIFKIAEDGILSLVAHQSTLGKTPRNFSIDPSGNFLLVANQNSHEIVIFRIDRTTGLLSDTGNRISVSKPVCLKWISNNH